MTHGQQQVIGAVHHLAHVPAMEASAIVRGPDIAVAACLAQRRAGEEVAWTRAQTFLDGAGKANVTTGYVTYRSEPAEQCRRETPCPGKCGIAQWPSLVRGGSQAECVCMKMRIDKSWNHGSAPGVMDNTARFNLPPYGGDPAIPDADGALNQVR
ncbi:hypothetical protein NtRootA1_12440 [Arthrobacter sp. NtRootA1]|nr:hypothetical protein NtRootA1_12440 [Arthrobacter sp. NtRootA1]